MGRRKGLKIPRAYERTGSSPVAGTRHQDQADVSLLSDDGSDAFFLLIRALIDVWRSAGRAVGRGELCDDVLPLVYQGLGVGGVAPALLRGLAVGTAFQSGDHVQMARDQIALINRILHHHCSSLSAAIPR